MRPMLVRTQEESAMPYLPCFEDYVPNPGAEPRRADTVQANRTPSGNYRQQWPAYNAAQVNEKEKFQLLLRELCSGIEEPIQTFGRPRLPLADMIFSAAFKVYSTFSGRRFMSDLREAHLKGHISQLPRYGSLFHYFELEMLTPYLQLLIEESSRPLSMVEERFAVDSSGLGTRRYVRWLHARYAKPQMINKADWIKVHLMCGVKTNIVSAVRITDGRAGDSPQFKPLPRRI
jgi:hypothetical protein